jgi:putative transposase
MQTTSQMIERYGNRTVRERVRNVMQPGSVTAVMESELNTLIADALNTQLQAEQEGLLGRAPYARIAESPSRNGYKRTGLSGLFGQMFLRRPVIREGTLRSPLLEALRTTGRTLRDSLAVAFWLRGTSTRATAEELNAALGTKLSRSTVTTLTNALEPTLKAWEARAIPAGITYLFLDALYLPVRRPGFTTEQALLVALGVDLSGQRHVLGFLLGDRESEASWTALVQDLLKRGLSRKTLRLVITDEHKGIEAAVTKRLGVAHQLCVVHLLRNVKARVAGPDWKAFLADLHEVFWAPSPAEARQALGRLEATWRARYPKAVAIAMHRFEDFTRFFGEPPKLWTLLRSTNLIERVNRELRRRLRPAGAMHSELEVTKLVWSVATEQEKRWAGRSWKVRGMAAKRQGQEARA